jgi:molybdopterin-guanine dinucleotide biosynthesis protein A
LLTGAILAGGESRRFGRNKALEVFRGKRLIDHNIETVKAFCNPVFVVANDLSPYYDVAGTLIQDIQLHQGPLGGIYTALLFSPHDWVLVKATDMPFLTPDLVKFMLKMKQGGDVVVPSHKGWYEPLLALYHRRCLSVIAEVLEKNEKQIVAFYSKAKVKVLSEEEWRSIDPEGRSFWNVNVPEDWERLKWS